MKFNFRKIAPVLASAVLLGSTVGFAAAATDLTAYPSTFVTKGKADVAIVIGETANAVDVIAGTDISSDLASIFGTAGTSAATVTGGESKAIQTDSQKLYFGDYLNNTKASLTDSDLPSLLAKGKVEDNDGTSYDYTQKINVPNTNTKWEKNIIDGYTSTTEPIMYVDFGGSGSSAQNYSYEISFTPAIDTTKLANKVIKIAGKEYTFSGNSAELNASDPSTGLVLYGSNVDATLATKQNATYNVNGVDVSVTVVGVNPNLASTSEGAATITVNGESASVAKGKSYTLGGQRVYIRDIMVTNTQPAEGSVRIFLGSDKLSLIHDTEVKKGATTLYGTKTAFTYSSGKVSKIVVTTTPSSLDTPVKYVAPGKEIVDPVFGYKISFAGMTPDLKDASRDKITIRPSAEDKAELSFTNKKGLSYTLNVLKPSAVCENSTGGVGACGANYNTYNLTTLGVDAYSLITTTNTPIAENDYFIVGSNEYTYIWRLSRVDANNDKIRVRDASAGSSDQEFSYSSGAGTISMGGIDVPFVVDEGGLKINVTSGASGILYTKGGARINLTSANAPISNSSTIIVTEETGYNDGDYKSNSGASLGSAVTVTIKKQVASRSGYDMLITSDTPADGTYVQVGDYTWKAVSKYGTYIEKTGSDDKKIEIYYPSAAGYLNVFVTAPTAVVSSTGATTAGKLGSISMTDVEAEAAKPSKNLIVIGGPAVNRVAAKILGVTYPYTGVLSGADAIANDEALLKLGANPYDSTKIALLVLGMQAKDTRAAATYLINYAGSADLASKTSVVLTTASGTAVVKK